MEQVASRRGACVEMGIFMQAEVVNGKSHPAGVRVLKFPKLLPSFCRASSHPAGVRVLKPALGLVLRVLLRVAPRRGACVETWDKK